MVKLMLISPRKLFEQSFLAGTIFAVAALTLLVDLAIIALRGYAFNLVSGWTGLSELGDGLEAIAYSCLVALVWYIVLAFLLVDVIATLLLPSRDLQEGAVISFGVIAIMQIPLVALFLKWELSWLNSITLQTACWLSQHSISCEDWWTAVRVFSLTTGISGLVLHLLLLALCACYVHTRPATGAGLLWTRTKKHGRGRFARRKKEAKEGKTERRQKKGDSAPSTTKGRTGRYDGDGSDSSDGSLDGVPPPASTISPPQPRSTASDVHTDSGSDSAVEKQPLRR
ncbi:hypothetical protein NBRC10512_007260 [Rhodotorula toruloides]|uniref:RHTO0S02e05292g1_1 n=2 Tax=Rhodotorula toruloides TaxID=5286 RepID=A0A061AHR5_RHOTO|nr:uncharacterized protein RHTO_01137 [Rhodotorula toruloides NP11]EMS21922.1 hypothetical protein RHTO_01137 [Rhodotorula toruloides NP11]CDR36667.1 RHTO0S02e05292g1_1 [Rhodotorula toruloides]